MRQCQVQAVARSALHVLEEVRKVERHLGRERFLAETTVPGELVRLFVAGAAA